MQMFGWLTKMEVCFNLHSSESDLNFSTCDHIKFTPTVLIIQIHW